MPTAALATESGEPSNCIDDHLEPETTCSGINDKFNVIETESWDSRATGIGSCTGLLLETWEGHECIGNGSGYDEVYCTAKCKGETGRLAVQNHSSQYGAYFTVWGQWE